MPHDHASASSLFGSAHSQIERVASLVDMKGIWRSLVGFVKRLGRSDAGTQPTSEQSPELEFEHERRRGMRGF